MNPLKTPWDILKGLRAAIPKRYFNFFLLSLAAAALFGLSYFRVLESYELQTYDVRCRLRGARPVSDDIVLIEIANDTVSRLGWPITRDYYSNLIDFLSEYGVKAVVFDILFVEPHEEDKAVAQSALKAGNVYFADVFSEPARSRRTFTSKGYLEDLLSSYRRSAKAVGFVNVVADRDGKRRRIIPMIRYQGQNYYQISFQVALDLMGVDGQKAFIDSRNRLNITRNFQIPLDDGGCSLISYADVWTRAFKHYSFIDILSSYIAMAEHRKPTVDLSTLKGKICFVGATATATHDINATPLEAVYPNVGIHANILNDLLMRDFIRRMGRLWNVVILFLLTAWVGWLAFQKKIFASFLGVVLTLVLFILAVVGLFIVWGIWVDLFLPLVCGVVVYTVAVFTRTIQEMRKRESIEKELKIASQIQRSFLPEKMPEHRGIQLAVHMRPAKQVGGDLYFFQKLDEGKLGVMVGDVSGKGTPAALFMAKVVSEFKFSARQQIDPAGVLLNLNDSVASESTGGLFVTLAYAVFDTALGKMTLSNGGHLPVVAVDRKGSVELLSAEEGMPIGVLPGVSFADAERPLKDGDVFAFYSDGVSEARNKKKEEYTIERLESVLSNARQSAADVILEKAILDLDKFMGKADQHDDITLIIVKITGSVDES